MDSVKSETTIRIVFGYSVLIFSLLMICEVSPTTAVISTAVLVLQMLVGGVVFTRLTNRDSVSWQEFCGVGLVIGSLSMIALDQIFRRTPIADYAWLLPVSILVLLIKNPNLIKNSETAEQNNYWVEVTVIGLAGLLFISTDWFWALPVVAVLAAVVCWQQLPGARGLCVAIGGLSLPVAIYAFLTRPQGWWVEDSDLALNEALTQTLKVWGVRDNINGFGTPTYYHWLAYGWSALLERVTGAPDWVMNSRVVPLIVSLSTALIIWAILSRLGNSQRTIFVSLALIGLYDTVPTWGRGFGIGYTPSPSQMFGLLLLLTTIYLVIEGFDNSSPRLLPLLFVMGMATVGAKVSHGAILAAAVGLLFVYELFTQRRLKTQKIIQSAVVILGVIVGFVVIVGGLSGSSRGMIVDQVAFVNGVTGDFRPFSLRIRWIAAIVLIFGFYAVPTLGLISLFQNRDKNRMHLLVLLFGVWISGLGFTMFLSAEFAVEMFFAHASSSVVVVFVAPLVAKQLAGSSAPRKVLALMVIAGFLATLIATFSPNLNSGSTTAIVLRLVPSLVGLIPLAVVISGALMFNRRDTDGRGLIRLSLVGLFAMSIGFFASNFTKNSASEYPEFSRNYESRVGLDKPDLLSASEWISQNTRLSAVFATNDFCEEISENCNSDTDWRSRVDFSMNCTRDQVLRWVGTDDCNPGGYKLLTALVDRRFLAGNFWVGISDGDALQPWVAKRVIDSVSFANAASQSSLDALKESNVEWFLLRKDLTNSEDWKNFGTIEFSNETYAVIKLN